MNKRVNTDFAKLYCPSMWKSSHLDVDGFLTPCCVFFRDKDKKKRITDVEDVETVLVEDWQEFRDQMTDGIWPKGCYQCEFAEKEGRMSKRLQDIRHMHSPGELSSDPAEVKLEYIQVKTGRLCNLRCTICSPTCSTSIATEHLRLGKISRERYDELNKQIEWASDPEEFKKFKPGKDGFYRIDIAGGEPLMNKAHFEWLDSIENPENTRLLYNTNGTQVPTREEIEIWKKFRGIWLSFSIDSYGENFEKLRVGAKWDQVLSNLKYLQEEVILKEFDPTTSNCNVVTTISSNNVKDVFTLHEILVQNINFNHPSPINFNYLYFPIHMACHNMSREEIIEVVELYEEKIPLLRDDKMSEQCTALKNSLQSYLDENKVRDYQL